MERNNDKISTMQFAMILSVTIIGVGILSLPRDVAEKVGPDGWILVVLGTFIVGIISLILSRLITKFPKRTMPELNSELVGKPIGMIITMGFFVYGVVLSAIVLRISGEVIKEYLLLKTPIEVIMFMLLITAVYLVRSGIEPIARISQIIFPIIIVIAVMLILPVVPEMDWSHLLPVCKTPILQIIKSLPIIILSFVGIELAMVFSVFLVNTENLEKNMYRMVGIVGSVYLFIITIVITRFGVQETNHITWPTLEIFKTVDLPGAFIENIEIFIIAIWICSVYMTLAVFYFSASLTLSWIVKTKKQKVFALPLLPIIYYLSLIPDNVAQITEYVEIFMKYMGGFYVFVLPIILYGVSMVRKGGKKGA